MTDEVRTERLLLRRGRPEDVEPMHRLLSDPRAMRYWSTPPHTTFAQTEAWMASMIEDPTDLRDDFVVTLDGEVIGKLGCWRLPEVGFLIDPAHWGKGLACEGLLGFIARRRALGTPALTADADPRNVASMRLLERCGFKETHRAERTFLVGDEWCDSVYYRLDLS